MGKYSDILMEHFTTPRNVGRMADPDRIGLVGVPGQGPFFLLCLHLKDGRVVEARHQCHGCGATIAAGSMLTEMIVQQPLAYCQGLTVERLTDALGGVPPDKLHSPALAIEALRAALGPDEVNARGNAEEDGEPGRPGAG
jgi:nitrogen fixation NifU-like protein